MVCLFRYRVVDRILPSLQCACASQQCQMDQLSSCTRQQSDSAIHYSTTSLIFGRGLCFGPRAHHLGLCCREDRDSPRREQKSKLHSGSQTPPEVLLPEEHASFPSIWVHHSVLPGSLRRSVHAEGARQRHIQNNPCKSVYFHLPSVFGGQLRFHQVHAERQHDETGILHGNLLCSLERAASLPHSNSHTSGR